MQGVNVFENGTGYLLKCLNLYTSGTGWFVLYLAALVYILIKGDERDRRIFIPQAVISLVTVYNPVVPLILDRIFDVNSEYYRLFWIAPVIVIVPYAASKLIFEAHPGREKILVSALVAAAFLTGGNFVYGRGIGLPKTYIRSPMN